MILTQGEMESFWFFEVLSISLFLLAFLFVKPDKDE
jgi:hypothetical protein